MKIVLIGKHELACSILDRLAEQPDVELAVVTSASESSAGRRSFQEASKQTKVRCLADSNSLYSEPILRFKPDLLLSAGFDKILKKDLLNQLPLALNVHFGKLPAYRGCYSIPHAILNNETHIGVTLHKIEAGIDDGAIVKQALVPNDSDRSCRDLYELAVAAGTELAIDTVKRLLGKETVVFLPQDETKATYYPMEFPHNYQVPWNQTTTYIYNYIRACHFPPYGGAKTKIGESEIEIGFPVNFSFERPAAKPGSVVKIADRYGVKTLNGILFPQKILCQGKEADFSQQADERGWAGQTARRD